MRGWHVEPAPCCEVVSGIRVCDAWVALPFRPTSCVFSWSERMSPRAHPPKGRPPRSLGL